MEQHDYLQRLIEQLGRVLGKISSYLLGLKNRGQIEEGIEIASQALKGELDLDIQELTDIPTDNFLETLKTKRGINNENLNKLADILFFIAENGQDKGKKELYEKCLTIYEYLEKSESVYSLIRQWKIDRIKKVL